MTLSGFDFVDTSVEALAPPKLQRVTDAMVSNLETTFLVVDPEMESSVEAEPAPLNRTVQRLLERIIEGDIRSLTTQNNTLIVQNLVRARGFFNPVKSNSVDYEGLLMDLVNGASHEEIAAKRGARGTFVSSAMHNLGVAILARQKGKIDLETFLTLEEPEGMVHAKSIDRQQGLESINGPTQRQFDMVAREAANRTSSAPEDWFMSPIKQGPPTARTPHYDPSSQDGYDPLAWQADSLCAQTDPEAFFPEKGGSTREAKKICSSCEVRAHCLEYALENDERFGIWGGLSERERRKLRRTA